MRYNRDLEEKPEKMHPDDFAADELLGRVLAGLRDAEASAGLERRVLTALQARNSSAAAWLPRPWRRQAAMATLAALLLVAVAIGFAIHPHPGPASARDQQPLPAGPLSLLAKTPAAMNPAAREPATEPAAIEPATPAKRVPSRASRLRRGAEHSPDSEANDPDAIARRETQAPSQPAPEMPLTAQEQLLLRLIHRGDPVELAALDPAVRAALFADDNAQFHKFFDRPMDGEKQ